MALVAYDNSDSSDYEDEENESASVVTLTKKVDDPVQQKQSTEIQNGDPEPNTHQSLFNRLPAIQKRTVIEEDDEFLHKKETPTDIIKPKSKISVPSLSDFEDVKNTIPITKPKFMNGKKSGLLSMLPQPKNSGTTSTSKSLIPHVLTKPPSTTVKKKTPIPSPSKIAKHDAKPSSSLINEYSDDSDDDMQNDFFSIHKTVELPTEELPLEIDQSSTSKVAESTSSTQPRSIESYFKQDSIENNSDGASHMESSDVYNGESSAQGSGYAASNETGEIVLDDEAILKLCGTRGKRKREDIQIVDVNQQEVLADAREWLLKGLMDDTSKRVSASKKRGNEPTSQQKRKHQITYLAHQAKANEIELQNQWANNRMTKRQTQSKYGF